MNILETTFNWQIALSELISLYLLILVSFIATYLGNKFIKYKIIFPIIYSLGVLLTSIIGYSLYKVLTINSNLNNTNILPTINPMGSLLFTFSNLIHTILTNSAKEANYINLLYLFLVHLLATILATSTWIIIKKKFRFTKSHKDVTIINQKNVLVDIGFIALFILLVVITQGPIKDQLDLNFFQVVSILWVVLFILLLTVRHMNLFSFPSNIYVSLASYLITLYEQKNQIKNAIFISYTILAYFVFSLGFSFLTLINGF
ncbi:hypothetical protein GE118_01810 [Mycoplasma sp. NEAQ87857]|uniref:hypothetical protein n=1 Tax=Mycoplasma sp. NEAQ87857 TaxID=2683967 RepID=UPI001317D02C|nr:hypothetical protein [Mycoplasma sp. NEAQ87857]QGZ97531.1 hypothetical protein GE118_01810 [Mycoplasma sp. NEAQ87857]